MKCYLEAQAEQVSVLKLDGLRIESGVLELKPEKFDCCGGTGMDFSAPSQLARKCPIRTRLRMARDFLADFLLHRVVENTQDFHLDDFVLNVPDQAQLQLWQHSEEMGAWAEAPEIDWQRLLNVGLAAAWRLGWEVHIFAPHLPHSQLHQAMHFKHDRCPQLMIIWGWRPVYDQHRLGELEQILNHACKSEMKVWFFADLKKAGPVVKSGRMRMPRSYRAGVSSFEQNSGDWLNGRMRSLVEEILGRRSGEFIRLIHSEDPTDPQRKTKR